VTTRIDGVPADAAFDHIALSVADLAAMRAWYGEALGFDRELFALSPAPELRIVMLVNAHGTRLELFARESSEPVDRSADPTRVAGKHGYTHWCLAVDDAATAYRALVGAGATPVWDPRPGPEPGVTMAFVADPEGNLIELMQHGPSRAAPE
jgi:lactoylglutathione lyase